MPLAFSSDPRFFLWIAHAFARYGARTPERFTTLTLKMARLGNGRKWQAGCQVSGKEPEALYRCRTDSLLGVNKKAAESLPNDDFVPPVSEFSYHSVGSSWTEILQLGAETLTQSNYEIVFR